MTILNRPEPSKLALERARGDRRLKLAWLARGAKGWARRGLCRPEDDEDMFAENVAERLEAAQRICRQCPVTAECLAYALDTHSDGFGVWGGTTPRERRPMQVLWDRAKERS